jgi:hypothetical protein
MPIPRTVINSTDTSEDMLIKLKFALKIPSFLLNLGIGIYAAIILANNSKDIISSDVYGFVMTICIISFVAVLNGLCCICQEKDKTSTFWSFVGLGMFIWSCVILFNQNGMDYKSNNPYYMFVFVYFLLSIILLGIAIIIIPFICCCMFYILSKDDIQTVHSTHTITSIVTRDAPSTTVATPVSTPAPPSTPVSTPDSSRASTPTNDTISIVVV